MEIIILKISIIELQIADELNKYFIVSNQIENFNDNDQQAQPIQQFYTL